MGLFDLRITKNLKVPFYDLATLAAGFFIGYNEGKGNYVVPQIEYLTKYGPTVFAVTLGPIMMKLNSSLIKFSNRGVRKNLESGEIIINFGPGNKTKLKELEPQERIEREDQIRKTLDLSESYVTSSHALKGRASLT